MENDEESRLERAILAILARESLGAKPSRIVGSLGGDFDANAVRPTLERMHAECKIAALDYTYCLPSQMEAIRQARLRILQHSAHKFREVPNGERRFNCSWERIEQWHGDWPEGRT